MSWRHRARGVGRDERGMTLVTVIAVSAVVFLLVTLMMVRSVQVLDQVRAERNWEQSLHTGEAGIDHTLFRLSSDRSFTTGEVIPLGAGSWTGPQERAWVLSQVDALDAAALAARTNAGLDGDWVVVKPANADIIYSVGSASGGQRRVVRLDYAPVLSDPLDAPDKALLVDGDFTVSGNARVSGGAHANGDVSQNGINSDAKASEVTPTTASGSCPATNHNGWCTEVASPVVVPDLRARDYYQHVMFDLCPDGHLRAGPAFAGPGANPTHTPCLGAVLVPAAVGISNLTWNPTHPDDPGWHFTGNAQLPGVYYAHRTNIAVNGNFTWNVALLAEGWPDAAGCPTGGSIRIKGKPTIVPFNVAGPLGSITLLADGVIELGGSAATGDEVEVEHGALVYARRTLKLHGNTSVTGAVIVKDTCSEGGSGLLTGNPEIQRPDSGAGSVITYRTVVGVKRASWTEL